jgi:2-hydroxy-3-oxopropionate reductase
MSGDRSIAFLGTGLMGAPMVRRLLDAGFAVTVWNRDGKEGRGACKGWRQWLRIRRSRGCQGRFRRLHHADRRQCGGRRAVFARRRRCAGAGRSSSIAVRSSRRCARACGRAVGPGHRPSGCAGFRRCRRGDGRDAGDHGGRRCGAVDVMADVFAPLGRVTHVGPSGTGQLAKLGNQQIVAVTIGAIAEAMMLVEAGGGSRRRSGVPFVVGLPKAGFSMSRPTYGGAQFRPCGSIEAAAEGSQQHRRGSREPGVDPAADRSRPHGILRLVEDGGGETDHSGLAAATGEKEWSLPVKS